MGLFEKFSDWRKKAREASARAALRDVVRYGCGTATADNAIYIYVGGHAVFRVTAETDLKRNELSVADAQTFIANVKETYVQRILNTDGHEGQSCAGH